MVSFRPKKYFCTICNKGFRRKKQHFNHVMRNKCKAPGSKNSIKKTIVAVAHQIQELVSLKPEIVHSEPQTTNYIGRPYNYVNIPSGNRHLRAGIPLPRISKYERAAI